MLRRELKEWGPKWKEEGGTGKKGGNEIIFKSKLCTRIYMLTSAVVSSTKACSILIIATLGKEKQEEEKITEKREKGKMK